MPRTAGSAPSWSDTTRRWLAASFSSDGALVATVSNDEMVAVWDTTTRSAPAHLLEGHVGSVVGVGFSIDGKSLYTSAADGSIMIWDIAGAGGVARRVNRDERCLLGSWVSSGSAQPLAASPWLGRRTTWIHLGGDPIELQSGRPFDTVWGAYSPDGERFVTVSVDSVLRLWNVADGELLAESPGRGVANRGAVAFTADGSTVVVADSDGTVTEHDGRTLEPTGRSLEVGVEPLGIHTV